LSFDTPIKDLIERDAQLLRRTDVSKADLCGRARPLLSRRVLLTAHGLNRLHMPKPTESPLHFASGCFPPASPAVVPEAGKQKKTPGDRSQLLICLKKTGAGEGIRTLDPDLGNAPAVLSLSDPRRSPPAHRAWVTRLPTWCAHPRRRALNRAGRSPPAREGGHELSSTAPASAFRKRFEIHCEVAAGGYDQRGHAGVYSTAPSRATSDRKSITIARCDGRAKTPLR
jgi:hypothetical protein